MLFYNQPLYMSRFFLHVWQLHPLTQASFSFFSAGTIQFLTCTKKQVYMSKLKNREEFEGGLHEKRKGKGGERRKKKGMKKHTLKYLYEA